MSSDHSRKRGRPPYPDVLTPRQQEVLTLVREGLTNPQIGERLGISPDGAKWHVSEIITRIGVTTRHEAADWDGASPMAALPRSIAFHRAARLRRRARVRGALMHRSPAVRLEAA